MEPERWGRIEEIFERALELPEAERTAYLDREAGDDGELRREVEALIEAHEHSGSFLEEPVIEGGISQFVGAKDEMKERRFGPYRPLKKLGEGGMSLVYLAVRADDEYQKLVALKVVRQGMDRGDLRRRFRTERQILASLDHPNIAKLLDGGTTEDGLSYFVMDYIEGMPIDEYCDRNRLPVRERLELFREVCSAVQYAHQNLVVHRDIKASNILVTADGTPKLLDFGIAKLLKPESFAMPVELTATRVRPMTPSYASPEQIKGRHITTATDVYSLGVLLYKLLTGRLPYRLESKTPREMEAAILEEEPERPSTLVSRLETVTPETVDDTSSDTDAVRRLTPGQLRRRLTGDLDNIVMMALRKEPQRRYASVEMLSEDVRRHALGLPVMAHKDSLRYRAGKFLRRNRLAIAVASGFAVLLVGFSLTMAVQARRLALERDRAQLERDRAEQVVGFLQEIFRISDPGEARGETVTAREILEQGARRVRQELAGQPSTQASLMEAIGTVYRNLGLFDWAEPLLRSSLELRREHLGEEHPEVARSEESLAMLLAERGAFDESESLLREALEIRIEAFGEHHTLVGQSLHQLAQIERRRGDLDAAEELHRRALDVQTGLLPSDHPQVAQIEGDLGIVLAEKQEFVEAEQRFRSALQSRRRWLGEDHPLTAQSLNDLGVLLGIMGRHEEAEPLFRTALALRRRVLGDRHHDTGESLNNLARLLREQGDFDGAEALYREGLRIYEESSGPRAPRVALLAGNLGVVLREKGELEEAEEMLRRALSIRREHLDPESPDLGLSLTALAGLLMRRGALEEAEELLLEAIRLYQNAFSSGHWRTAEAQTMLGETLAGRGLYAEAEPLLLEGYRSVEEALGADHRRTADARRRVRELYELWGKPEEAARYRAAGSG